MIAALPRAYQSARRALQLDPDLAEAHDVIAAILGNESPAAISHLRRAAQLGRNSAEGQFSGALAHEVSGEYSEALAAYRQAHELDPLWPMPLRALVNVHPLMGDRATAEAIARNGMADDPSTQNFALARIARISGDLSEASRRYSIAANESGGRWASPARLSLEEIRYILELSGEPPSRPPRPTIGSSRFGPRVWMTGPPTAEEWRARNRSLAAALVNYDENVVAAKMMLTAGRVPELLATYDGPTGLLSISRGQPLGPCQLDEAAVVALALRRGERAAESDALLNEANKLIDRVYRRGRVPAWFDEDAAGIWAVQGKKTAAIEALDRALRRGWIHLGRTDLPKIEEEPAFRLLWGDPRFEALRGKYEQHYARERAETAQALRIRV